MSVPVYNFSKIFCMLSQFSVVWFVFLELNVGKVHMARWKFYLEALVKNPSFRFTNNFLILGDIFPIQWNHGHCNFRRQTDTSYCIVGLLRWPVLLRLVNFFRDVGQCFQIKKGWIISEIFRVFILPIVKIKVSVAVNQHCMKVSVFGVCLLRI